MAQSQITTPQLPPSYFKQPLSKPFYGLLLKLEEKVNAKIISTDEVSKLTEMYGQLVSYYDALMDPIKHYFMEKIQMVLLYIQQEKSNKLIDLPSRKTSSIFEQNRKISKKKSKEMKTTKSLSQSSASDHDEDEDKDIVDNLPGNEDDGEIRSKNVSISDIKKSRQKKMSLLLQVNKAQEGSSNQYNQLLGSYDSNTSKNDQNVKQQLKEQQNQLQKRIEDRRKNRQNKKSVAQDNQNDDDLDK